jgi:hypothetical protein
MEVTEGSSVRWTADSSGSCCAPADAGIPVIWNQHHRGCCYRGELVATGAIGAASAVAVR